MKSPDSRNLFGNGSISCPPIDSPSTYASSPGDANKVCNRALSDGSIKPDLPRLIRSIARAREFASSSSVMLPALVFAASRAASCCAAIAFFALTRSPPDQLLSTIPSTTLAPSPASIPDAVEPKPVAAPTAGPSATPAMIGVISSQVASLTPRNFLSSQPNQSSLTVPSPLPRKVLCLMPRVLLLSMPRTSSKISFLINLNRP